MISSLKIVEAAENSGIDQNIILKFILNEWVVPLNKKELTLDEEDIERIKLIRELGEEFGVNDEAIPIILHLIDQLNHLHLSFKNNYCH